MSLTLDAALALVRTALSSRNPANAAVAIAVVDRAGRTLACARSEECGHINLEVAHRKAAAAANFGAPTHGVLEMLRPDPVALAAVMNEPSLCILPGGFPIVIDGKLAGGLGVAGAHYTEDQAIGERALTAVAR